jgi:putative ABC transport system permease protein
MERFLEQLLTPVNLTAVVITLVALVAGLVYAVARPKMFMLLVKNLRRNIVRTLLISLATMVLVAKVTLIWTVIYFLDQVTQEKAKDFKLIITERWQIPSQMPLTHADYLDPDNSKFLPELRGLYGRDDFMTWSFYGGTTDPAKMSIENLVFMFSMKPAHIPTMMEDLDKLDPRLIKAMEENRIGVLMGKERMAKIDKRVGERFKLTSINYKGIDLEFEILGELPEGRYDMSAIMNAEYFNQEIERYAQRTGQRHPLDQKRLNLVWIRVPDRAAFDKVGSIVENSPFFADRPVRCETASSGIGNFLDAYRDLINGMKFGLVPIILMIMALVVANAISISVRERRAEIAVMKVLGYRPNQILNLVIGESLLVGALAGWFAALGSFLLINYGLGGVKFPIAFFPAFMIPAWALAWGPAMGCLTALVGSFIPAWTARNVKVSEVFAKIA